MADTLVGVERQPGLFDDPVPSEPIALDLSRLQLTLREVIERLESKYGKQNRIWAFDRGMVSEEHLQWLRERGSRYIMGTPKTLLRKLEQALLDGTWQEIRDGLKVQQVKADEGEGDDQKSQQETFILCRSTDRASKERAMRERFVQRIEEGLEQLQQRCLRAKSGPLESGAVERSIGRLLGSESINSTIQWVKYTARGFRNFDNFVTAIYFH